MNHDDMPRNIRQEQNARKRMLILLACAVLHAALERYHKTVNIDCVLFLVTTKRPLQEILEIWPSENNQRIRRFHEKIEELKTIMYIEVETMRYNPNDMEMDFGIEIKDDNNEEN